MAKTSAAQDVISQALNKSRKDSVGECRIPENYVLVSPQNMYPKSPILMKLGKVVVQFLQVISKSDEKQIRFIDS